MNKSNINQDPEKPSLSQYFSQTTSTSSGASFFDQISSGDGPAMMTSIRESADSQDLFKAANIPLNLTDTCHPTQTTTTVSSTVIHEGSVHKPLESMGFIPEISTSSQVTADTGSELQDKMLDVGMKTPVKEEPIVCRIFSSHEAPSDGLNMASGKSFFDMLGSTTVRSPHSIPSPSVASALFGMDLMIPGLPTSSSASSMMTSPEFTTTTDGSFLTPSSPTTPTPTGEEILKSTNLYVHHDRSDNFLIAFQYHLVDSVRFGTEHLDWVVSTSASYLGSLGFRHRPGDQLLSLLRLWFYSVPPSKFQDSTLN